MSTKLNRRGFLATSLLTGASVVAPLAQAAQTKSADKASNSETYDRKISDEVWV